MVVWLLEVMGAISFSSSGNGYRADYFAKSRMKCFRILIPRFELISWEAGNHIWWKFCPTCPSFSLFNIEIIKQVSTDERRTMFAQHHLMSLSTNWELKTENKIVSILFCFLFWTFVGVISLFFLLYNWCISLSLKFVIWGNGFSSSVLL